ncbi:rna-directed dna polymerase from mobile element jockey-like [Pitangus sulphuratus]|nr:rna-directed dna polymerase from mobile element jockey-like [Pitangus sulphuratus]
MPGKVTEQIILSAIAQHVQDNQRIRASQHEFGNGRSCLTSLVSFYDKVTHLVDERKAVDFVYVDFSKAFDIVSHNTFPWLGCMYSRLGKNLAKWLGPESGGEWSFIQLVAGHKWCPQDSVRGPVLCNIFARSSNKNEVIECTLSSQMTPS